MDNNQITTSEESDDPSKTPASPTKQVADTHLTEESSDEKKGKKTNSYSTAVPGLQYKDVPFYRRRWVYVLLFIFLTPTLIVITLTGDLYYYDSKTNQVMKVSQQGKTSILIITVIMTITLLARLA